MFDFEKMEIYRQAKSFHIRIKSLVQGYDLQNPERNQLVRASLSIVLNIAEGAGRFSKRDKRNFYVIARGSVNECIAIVDLMKDQHLITEDHYRDFYAMGEEISRMLYSLIRQFEV
ncbi:MAG: four helix bundle protein [Bacteroidales bacterium]|nr:four helix bundle protein [Bacteroidales bacterium]